MDQPPEGPGDGLRQQNADSEVLAHYEQVATSTDRLVVDIDDLNRSFPRPNAPWFEPGAERSVRRTIVQHDLVVAVIAVAVVRRVSPTIAGRVLTAVIRRSSAKVSS